MIDTHALGSFQNASEKAFRYLRGNADVDCWLIARIHASHWLVISTDDPVFGFEPGLCIRWDGSNLPERRRRPGRDLALIACGRVRFPGRSTRVAHDLGTLAAFPLSGRDGTTLGVLCGMDSASNDDFDDGLVDTAELISGLLGLLLENEIERNALTRTSERFRVEAMTDALTGLPNRRAWEEKLQAEQHRLSGLGESTFLSVIDLDALKRVNDCSGHHAGDRVLRDAARVLERAVRDSDFVARVGGDEFAVLGLPSGAVDADWISARFTNALKAGGIDASVGTVLACPGQPLGSAWARADLEMYARKRSKSDRGGRAAV